jgi:hypothetical protein
MAREKHYYAILIIVVIVLIIIIVLNKQTQSPQIAYRISDINGKWITTKNDIDAYEKLIKEGAVIYLSFSQRGNNKYSEIDISLYSLEKHYKIKIDRLEFVLENEEKIVLVNKIIKLNQEQRTFLVEESNENSTGSFFQIISRDNNRIKIYLQEILNKKNVDIGKNFEILLKTYYFLDNNDVIIQENTYIISVVEKNDIPPNWMFILFPYM